MNAKRTSGDGIIQVQIRKDIPTQLLPGELVMYQSSPTTGVLYKGNPDGSVSLDDTSTDIRLASGDETHLYLKWNTGTGQYDALTLAELKTALAYTTSDVGFHAYRSVSQNATLNEDTDVYLEVDATSGNKTVNVPSAITNAGKMFVVKKVDSSSNYVAVTPFVANQRIDGIEYHYLRVQYASMMIYSDGAHWKVIAKTPVIMEGTPVNAVASSKVLTVAATPAEGETVTIGSKTYKARLDALGAGVQATGTLTFNGLLPHDGDTVILGNTTYVFREILTGANEIKLAHDTVQSNIDNLVAAINGTGTEGVEYGEGTVSQGMVTASSPTNDTMRITYDTVGALGNQYDTAGTLTHATWGETHLTGGIDAQAANDIFVDGSAEHFIDNLVLAITGGAGVGVKYGTGTVAHTTVTAAKTTAATMTVTAKTKGVAGDLIAIAESLGNASSKWAGDATFLGGGVNGTLGLKTDIYFDSTYMYIAIADNTIADANWRRIALGSSY